MRFNYPLNVALAAGIGFAVANDETEHADLTSAGYVPALDKASAETVDFHGYTLESARAALDDAGISYDKRMGLAKLVSLLPAAE